MGAMPARWLSQSPKSVLDGQERVLNHTLKGHKDPDVLPRQSGGCLQSDLVNKGNWGFKCILQSVNLFFEACRCEVVTFVFFLS